MGAFDLKTGNGKTWWNYTDQNKEGYSLQITGDVVEMMVQQQTDFQTKAPKFTDSGQPIMEFIVTLAMADGNERLWAIRHWMVNNAIIEALKGAGLPGQSLEELAGLNITVATQNGSYGKGRPRPFFVTINGQGTAPFRGAIDNTSQQPAPQVQQAVPQVQYGGQPVVMQPVQQTPMQQAVQSAYNAAHAQPQDPYGPDLDGML